MRKRVGCTRSLLLIRDAHITEVINENGRYRKSSFGKAGE